MKTTLARSLILAATLGATLATVATSGAQAQGADSWPSRPVTMVVPLAPGASVDIETRLYANELSKNLGGKPFVVDFKPGAGTTLGLAYVGKSAPDGHTLGSITPSATINKLTLPNVKFDALTDVTPVSLMSMRPILITVHPSLPVNSLKEFIAYAKSNPGKINAGTSGAGTLSELGWGWFQNLTDTKVTLIHYKGGGPSFAAVLAGEVHVIFGGFSTAAAPIRAGKLKALAISTPERAKRMPDVPTVAELGVPFNYVQWIGIAAAAGTPPALVNRISAELAKVAKSPEINAKLDSDATLLVGSSPQRFREIIAEETSRWTRIARETGMKFGAE
jgi:tripartite-type tricarboxylate transporter receptor subunit TctC